MKQNFGLDGVSADFTFGKGKVVPEYKICRLISGFFELKKIVEVD